MTYEKVNPLWRTQLKPVSSTMPITSPLDIDTKSGLRAPFNTPTDLCCILSIPITQSTPCALASESLVSELHMLVSSKASSLSSPTSTNSPIQPEDDDDYDYCDEYENGFGDHSTDDLFMPVVIQERWTFDDAGSEDDASSASDSSDHEDYFGFDFEASPLDASVDSPIPDPILHDLPHWWGEEDQDHLAEVLIHYDHVVAIAAEKRRNIRAAAPFVGRVVRHQVPSSDSLQSIDEVFIHRYELIPFGQTMPLIRTHWVLTTWDAASGLPTTQSLITNRVAQSVWLPTARSTNVTTIFCEPDASNPSSFVLSTDRDGLHRGSISIGYFNAYNSWSRFFPESTFQHNLPEDD